MTTKKTYSHAVALIKKGKIQQSLKEAEKLPFERFLDFTLYCKDKEGGNALASGLFWSALIKTRHCLRFFQEPNSYSFLRWFFHRAPSIALVSASIDFLASNHPDCLIKAIRVSKAFLKNEWYSLFENKLQSHSNSSISLHFQCFRLIKGIENRTWNLVEEKSHCLQSYDKAPLDLLNLLALWFELQELNRDKNEIQKSVETLNLALTYLLGKNRLQISETISEIEIAEALGRSINTLKKSEEDRNIIPVFEWLNQLNNWNDIKQSLIDTYCFDLNFEPEMSIEGKIQLKPVSIEKFKDWYDNGIKINMMFNFYKEIAEIELQEAVSTGKIRTQTGKAIQDDEAVSFHLQQHIALNAWSNIFSDFHFEAGKRPNSAMALIRFFGKYSSNCFSRWRKFILEKAKKSDYINSNDLLKILFLNYSQKRDISWLRHDSFNRICNKINEEVPNGDASALFNFLVWNGIEKVRNNEFNRFSVNKKLYSSPFLKFGDNVFVFTSVIANTRPIAILFDNILNQNKDDVFVKGLSEKFEDRINKQFEASGFITQPAIDKKFSNESTGENGDIDALAYKDGYLFVIEAKLAAIRITLEETQNELNCAFLKAASQLNKILAYIEFNFPKIKAMLGIRENSFNELKVFPLIVSTSFESDHEQINWCEKSFLKISWHELMLTLIKELEPRKIVEIIKRNEGWEILDSFPSPSKTDALIVVGSIKDLGRTSSASLHNSANDLFNKGSFDEAITFLNEAISKDENYAPSYILLGECYSSKKEFSLAEESYLKAINIDPYDAVSYFHLARLYYDFSFWDKAYKYFKMAISCNPLNEVVYINFLASGKRAVQCRIISKSEWENEIKEIEERKKLIVAIQLIDQFS